MADEGRSFPNPFRSDKSCKEPKKRVGSGGDVLQILAAMREDLLTAVTTELPAVDRQYTTSNRDQSVYTGVAGAALLHLHLATTVYRSDSDRSRAELVKALDLLKPYLESINDHRSTFLCGAAGPLAIGAVLYSHLGQEHKAGELVQRLKDLFLEHKVAFRDLPSELLYGHAGYLYALLFANSHLPGAVEEKLIDEVASLLLSVGQAGCNPAYHSPLMYSWHGKHYLGAAHGLAGIMTVLMQVASPVTLAHLQDLIKPCVDYLLSLQLPSGNFPSSLESVGKDRLVHWCHGAPGFCHMLALAHRVFGDSKYLQAAERCGDVVWERGLLKKGYGLCHGVAGNGYVFLQLYRLTGQQHHLHRAMKFAEWCMTSGDRRCPLPDHPFSLFEGLAGKLYFLADMCNSDPLEARYPALELPAVHTPLPLKP